MPTFSLVIISAAALAGVSFPQAGLRSADALPPEHLATDHIATAVAATGCSNLTRPSTLTKDNLRVSKEPSCSKKLADDNDHKLDQGRARKKVKRKSGFFPFAIVGLAAAGGTGAAVASGTANPDTSISH